MLNIFFFIFFFVGVGGGRTGESIPAEESSKTILSDRQSKKFCLTSDVKSIAGSTCPNLGRRNGEEIEMEDRPLSNEFGSDKYPGSRIKSTRYSLYDAFVTCQ